MSTYGLPNDNYGVDYFTCHAIEVESTIAVINDDEMLKSIQWT